MRARHFKLFLSLLALAFLFGCLEESSKLTNWNSLTNYPSPCTGDNNFMVGVGDDLNCLSVDVNGSGGGGGSCDNNADCTITGTINSGFDANVNGDLNVSGDLNLPQNGDINAFNATLGGNANVTGSVYASVYRPTTGSSITLRTPNSGTVYVDYGANMIWRDIDAGYATRMSLDSATGLLTLNGNLSSSGTGTFKGTTLDVGEAGATQGFFRAYGSPTGSSEGGEIDLYTADDYDTNFDNYKIDVYQENLRIFPVTATFVHQMYSDGNTFWDGALTAGQSTALMKMGSWVGSPGGYAAIAASTMFDTTGSYALIQNASTGATYVNAASGQSVNLRVNNGTSDVTFDGSKLTVDTNTVVTGTIQGTTTNNTPNAWLANSSDPNNNLYFFTGLDNYIGIATGMVNSGGLRVNTLAGGSRALNLDSAVSLSLNMNTRGISSGNDFKINTGSAGTTGFMLSGSAATLNDINFANNSFYADVSAKRFGFGGETTTPLATIDIQSDIGTSTGINIGKDGSGIADNVRMYWANNNVFRIEKTADAFATIDASINFLETDIITMNTNGTEWFNLSSAGLLSLSSSGEMLRLADNSTTGSPYLSWFQTTTRRAYAQYLDASDRFRIANEYGDMSFWTGTGGTEVERVTVTTVGDVNFLTGSLDLGYGKGINWGGGTPVNITATSAIGVQTLSLSSDEIIQLTADSITATGNVSTTGTFSTSNVGETDTNASGAATVTLNYAMSDANYFVSVTPVEQSNTTNATGCSVYGRKTTEFQFFCSVGSFVPFPYVGHVTWMAVDNT